MVADRHGDAAALATGTGELIQSRVWSPHGELAGNGGHDALLRNLDVGFQGDWTLPTSGEVNMGARWYEPILGAFTSRDTVMGGL